MKKAGLLIGLVLFALVPLTHAADLAFTEGNNFKENGSFIVMGFVQNTSPYVLKDITITVKFYDKEGRFLRFGTASANPVTLDPGEEANYQIVIPDDQRIASIKKTARWTVKDEN